MANDMTGIIKWGAIGLAGYYVYTHFIALPAAPTGPTGPTGTPTGTPTPAVQTTTVGPPAQSGVLTSDQMAALVAKNGADRQAAAYAALAGKERLALIAANGGVDAATMDVWNYYLSAIRGKPVDPNGIDLFTGDRNTLYTSAAYYAALAANGLSGISGLLYRRGAYR